MTSPQPDLLETLNFTATLPCESELLACDFDPAEWVATFTGPLITPHTQLLTLCTPCRDWYVEHLTECRSCSGLITMTAERL